MNTFIKDKQDSFDSLTDILTNLSLQDDNKTYDINILNDYKNRLQNLLSKNKLIIKQKQYLENIEKIQLMKHTEIEKYLDSHPDIKLVFQPGTYQIAFGATALSSIYKKTKIRLKKK